MPLLECHFWGNGVVGMGADMNLYVAEGYAVSSQLAPSSANGSSSLSDVHTYVMATNINPERGYASMAIAPPSLSMAMFDVLLAQTMRLHWMSPRRKTVFEAELVPTAKMFFDPSGRYLAC